MSLLRDIQATAVESDSDVATLLRKCKILAVRLGNNDFKRWVDQELNGYSDISQLPKYRKLRVESLGNFSGPFGSILRNASIPSWCIPEEFRKHVEYSFLMQPISAYISLVENFDGQNPVEKWPSELVARFGYNFYEDMSCLSAWKVIPYNSLAALIDTLKTRILNFSLEIESEAPDAGEAPVNNPPLPQEKVSHVFNTFITGNIQNMATGSEHFKQSASITFDKSDELFKKMLDAVINAQADANAITELTAVIEEMRGSQGTNGFSRHYQSFTSLLADHIQIFGPLLAPYLPLLAQMVTR